MLTSRRTIVARNVLSNHFLGIENNQAETGRFIYDDCLFSVPDNSDQNNLGPQVFAFLFEKMMFKVFVASATTLSMALSVSAQLANCARNYTVQPGDVCDAISAANHVSTYGITSSLPFDGVQRE